RKEQRRRRFGPDAVCLMCGETDPVAFHHVAGRKNDDSLESPLCLNCHAKAHEALRDAGVSLETRPRRTLPERIEAVLRALATFLELLARSLHNCAGRLGEFISRLDEAVPEWREWKEARA
ncbi:MAG: hypothetical protein ACRD1T_02585, partial [Acidimicrobiia bacterium]